MWWIRRLTCWLDGHRDLCLAEADGEMFPGGQSKELHYCARCGRAVWTLGAARGKIAAAVGGHRPVGKVRAIACGAAVPAAETGGTPAPQVETHSRRNRPLDKVQKKQRI